MFRKQYIFLLLAFLSVAAVIVAVRPPAAPELPTELDPEFETNFSIGGSFKEYFYAHGGLDVFGNPITAAFMEDGLRVQYFQNLCLELIVTTEERSVRLCALGQRANTERLESDTANSGEPQSNTSIADGEFPVGYDFTALYEKLGGEMFIGPPVNEAIQSPGGRVEQHFLNAKFLYDPADPDARVTLAPLGEVYVSKYGHLMDPAAFQANMDATVDDTRGLHVILSVDHPLCDPTYIQVVNVNVTRVDGEPAENAQVEVWFSDSNGNVFPDTNRTHNVNDQGYTQVHIPTPQGEQGEYIFVNVEASYSGVTKVFETTYFEIWKIR